MSEVHSVPKPELHDLFPVEALHYYPQTIKDGQGMAVVYLNARDVQQRLDDVVTPAGWQDAYRVIDPATRAVECQLTVLLDGTWITKADIGYPNSADDADNPEREPLKAAYSDAFKRAGVQFGIGRYLYMGVLEKEWLPVENKRFTEPPVVLKQFSPDGERHELLLDRQKVLRSAPEARPQQQPHKPRQSAQTKAQGGVSAVQFAAALTQGNISDKQAAEQAEKMFQRPVGKLTGAEKLKVLESFQLSA